MAFRSLTAAVIAAGLGTFAAPALARTVHVMGLRIEQPDTGRYGDVRTTGSIRSPRVTQRGRAARPVAKTR